MTFDPVTHAFGPVIPANYAETFSLNSTTNVVMDSSDSSPFNTIDAIDVADGRACQLTDTNLTGDQDGASTDSATNITVISNEDGTATVLNLNGSTFAPPAVATTPCTLDETTPLPNSVLVSGLPSSTAGSAVNGTTHQAFLIEDGSPGASLIQLPSSPVAGQIVAGDLGAPSISSIPNDPLVLEPPRAIPARRVTKVGVGSALASWYRLTCRPCSDPCEYQHRLPALADDSQPSAFNGRGRSSSRSGI